jgi:release factor glutamine methyltransferase
VLIPRPETECLVEAAVSLLYKGSKDGSEFEPKRILELGTGSGAIILALAARRWQHLFFASDRSLSALLLARENAGRHGLDQDIRFFCGDWLAPLNNNRCRFDLIISNPPYIQTRAVRRLQPEIYEYEPIAALDGGRDGLDCLRRIIKDAHLFLNARGSLLLEIGHDQRTGINDIVDRSGNYENVVFKKDYSGYDRVVQMRKKL